MLKHLPATIFFLCLFAVIINVSLDGRMDVYLGAIAIGTLAMLVQHFMEKKDNAKPALDREQQTAHWQKQWAHVDAVLREARKSRTDERIPFLESQLAEAERQLKKLGASKPAANAG